MAHDHHSRGHHHSHDHGTGILSFAFWLNTAFTLLEIAGGLYTNSVAILSDAVYCTMDGEYNVLTAHAMVSENLTFSETKSIKQSVKT